MQYLSIMSLDLLINRSLVVFVAWGCKCEFCVNKRMQLSDNNHRSTFATVFKAH